VTSKRKIRKQLARDRDTAFHDARQLALDLTRGQSSIPFDPMCAGVVLQAGEIAYRQVPAIYSQLIDYGLLGWTQPINVTVLVTDQRAFMRWPDGSLLSLWWNNVQGFEANLRAETLILDYGDGQPRCLAGPTVPVIAVAGIAVIYGADAMLRHPAIAPLRVRADAVSDSSLNGFTHRIYPATAAIEATPPRAQTPGRSSNIGPDQLIFRWDRSAGSTQFVTESRCGRRCSRTGAHSERNATRT
jgi:hypothetical protein